MSYERKKPTGELLRRRTNVDVDITECRYGEAGMLDLLSPLNLSAISQLFQLDLIYSPKSF